jgi:hypothetical protein
MSDTKLADLTALTAPSGDDLLYVVDDPAGTPADRKIALDNLFTRGTVTTSSPVIDAAQTWNAVGTTFTGLKFNATDTASAAASLLMDLQVGGASRFSVTKAGTVTVAVNATVGSSGISFIFGSNKIAATNGLWGSSGSGEANFAVLNSLGFASANVFVTNPDTFFGRRGAANLRFGAADAAAPVAQTLSVQSVVAGTTNTAGANLTITGSQGTGTGAGGSIIFQVAPAGSSGTAQNALSTALEIIPDGLVSFGAATRIGFRPYQGGNWLAFWQSGGPKIFFNSLGNLSLQADSLFGFSSGNFGPATTGATLDVILARDAANTLALRNGANAQESRVYGSYTSATNFQRMSIKTLRESSGALSGASYTTTIAIPAYANLIGVTTRVTTEVTGATTYDVGDGSDVDLWGAAIGVALGSQSRTANFTAVAAVGAAATSRTVTLTANGSNFTGGVIEICLHYLTTEAD